MAYMCQGCSEEGEVWPGECPNCHSKQYLNLAPKKADWVGLLIDGRYRIESKLGQGGMGTVYKAIREGMGQALAIKVLNPEFSNEPDVVRRFLREAKSYGMVQHPNAVNLLDFGQLPDGALYIAMEYIAGKDLSKTIQDLRRIPVADAIDIAVQCCDVLGFAHEKGIIHRDLKPENIMLVKGLRSYHAKVLDFGIARLVSDNATQLTVAGTICGTPRYMSPEQARGKDVDLRSDIYSLSLVLFEMLTGRQAYTYSSITELLRAQVTEPVPHVWDVDGIRDLPEPLDAVLQKATSKDREQRYISMGQFADALSRALPTVNSMGPYSDPSRPQLDPAGPGRTFLGPGAPGGILEGGSGASLPPINTGPGIRIDETGATFMPGSLPRVELPQPPVGSAFVPGDGPSSAGLSAQHTLLKQPTNVGPAPQKSPSIPLANERPLGSQHPPPSKVPWIAGAIGLASIAVIAVVVVPKMGSNKAPDSQPPPPLAHPADPPPSRPPTTVTAVAPPNPPPPPIPTPGPPPTPPPPTVAQVVVSTPNPNTPNPPRSTLLPSPTLNPRPPNSRPLPPPKANPNDAASQLIAAAMMDRVGRARDEFREGHLEMARTTVGSVDASSSYGEAASHLLQEIDRVADLNSRARKFADTGDCTSATDLWKQALQLSPGFGAASQGISRCKSAAIPTKLDD